MEGAGCHGDHWSGRQRQSGRYGAERRLRRADGHGLHVREFDAAGASDRLGLPAAALQWSGELGPLAGQSKTDSAAYDGLELGEPRVGHLEHLDRSRGVGIAGGVGHAQPARTGTQRAGIASLSSAGIW